MPTADGRPTSSELAGFVYAYYRIPGNESGGSLHIVLDDGNYRDSHVRSCLRRAQEAGDVFGARLAVMLLAASRTQRSVAASGAHTMLQMGARREREHQSSPISRRRLTCWHS